MRPASAQLASIACSRAAFAMLSFRIARIPAAAAVLSRSSGAAIPGVDGHRSGRAIQRDRAVGESVGVQPPQHQVGIRHGCSGAAAAVAGRSRHRPGAPRSDLQPPERIDARQRTAARPDLAQFHDREAERQSATGAKAVDAAPTSMPPALFGCPPSTKHSLAVVPPTSSSNACGRSNSVAIDAAKMAPPAGPDSSRRTGNRIAAAASHSPPFDWISNSGPAMPLRAQTVLQGGQVPRHQGLDIRIRHDGGEPFVFPDFRRHLRAGADWYARQMVRQDSLGARLMPWVAIGVHETDCHRLHRGPPQGVRDRHDRIVLHRNQHLAIDRDALAHREAQAAFDQRRGTVDQQVVLVVTVLVSHLQYVPKPFGRDEPDPGAPPLDHGIGRQRRPVDHRRDGGRRDVHRPGDPVDPVEHGALGRLGRRQQLEAVARAVAFDDEIREGATDIDSDPSGMHTVCNHRVAGL